MPSGAKLGIEGSTLSQGLELQTPTTAHLDIQTLPNKMFLKTCHVLHRAECWCRMLAPGESSLLEMALGRNNLREGVVPGHDVKGSCMEKVAWYLRAGGQNLLLSSEIRAPEPPSVLATTSCTHPSITIS